MFAAAPFGVGLAALVQLAQPGDQAVLVPLARSIWSSVARRISAIGVSGPSRGIFGGAYTVAVEHLQRAHRHTVRLLESIRAPQRANLGELFDDVLLWLAPPGDLLEDRSFLLGRVCAQDAQCVDPVEQQIVEPLFDVVIAVISMAGLRSSAAAGVASLIGRRVVRQRLREPASIAPYGRAELEGEQQ